MRQEVRKSWREGVREGVRESGREGGSKRVKEGGNEGEDEQKYVPVLQWLSLLLVGNNYHLQQTI